MRRTEKGTIVFSIMTEAAQSPDGVTFLQSILGMCVIASKKTKTVTGTHTKTGNSNVASEQHADRSLWIKQVSNLETDDFAS